MICLEMAATKTKQLDFFDHLRKRTAEYRQSQAVSQDSLAEKLGVAQSAIWRFEKGKGILREAPLAILVSLVFQDVMRFIEGHAAEAQDDSVQMGACIECGEKTPTRIDGKRVNFCAVCGELLGLPCPQCNTINDHDAKFCKGCGYALTLEAAVHQADYEVAVERLSESKEDRAKREDMEKRERAKARRKRGEPEL